MIAPTPDACAVGRRPFLEGLWLAPPWKGQTMRSLLYGLAALPFLAGVALAGQPMQLTDKQMDNVTAGFDLKVTEISNTSWTQVSIYSGELTPCSLCYLTITSRPFSVESAFGPTPN